MGAIELLEPHLVYDTTQLDLLIVAG